MNELKIDFIREVHENSILLWQKQEVQFNQKDFFLDLVEKNHAFNYWIWYTEDKARCDDKGHAFVFHAKREIDHYNQQRNNTMEAMDEWLFTFLKPSLESHCPLHSETPAMIVDRLSILTLKTYHMQQQLLRSDVEENHRQTCLQKWQIIKEQKEQLFSCLGQLLDDIRQKKRSFKIYYQFKMYNDPTLNPALYSKNAC